jgi:hypothetical protein
MNGAIWSWCIKLNKNDSCSVIDVVLYYSISIHEIVIKCPMIHSSIIIVDTFYMSNDSFKYSAL